MELETLLCCLALPRYNIIGKSGYNSYPWIGGIVLTTLTRRALIFPLSYQMFYVVIFIGVPSRTLEK